MNNYRNDDRRNSVPVSKMSKRELDQSFADLNNLAQELNDKTGKNSQTSDYVSPVDKPMRNLAQDREDLRNSSRNLKKSTTQAERDAEYYQRMSMDQGYDAMKEGLEYQLRDSTIRENNSWFIDESKEANPYEKRDDGDFLRRMDKIWLNDNKDYYQNVSLSYRYPIAFTVISFCAVFIGIPVLLFLFGMMILL